jgi:hypothetical protein
MVYVRSKEVSDKAKVILKSRLGDAVVDIETV